MDTEKKRLIKKFHTLLMRGGISNEEKQAMLASYGVTSSKDMNIYELLELCGKIDRMVSPSESDRLRKRVIASACAYFSECGCRYDDPVAAAKKMACRISGQANFNRIPDDRLRSIYHALGNRVRDMRELDQLTASLLTGETTLD